MTAAPSKYVSHTLPFNLFTILSLSGVITLLAILAPFMLAKPSSNSAETVAAAEIATQLSFKNFPVLQASESFLSL